MLAARRSPRLILPFHTLTKRTLANASLQSNPLKDSQDIETSDRKERRSPEALFGSKRIGQVTLPADLQNGIQKIIDEADRKLIREDALRIFESFASMSRTVEELERSRVKFQRKVQLDPNSKPTPPMEPHTITYGSREAVAYLAAVFPATYAALYNVLAEVRDRIPNFSPTSLLDFGTGPGTAIWAARDVLGLRKGLRYVGVDISEPMIALAEKLASYATDDNRLDQIDFYRYFSYNPQQPRTDLVIAAYALSDLPSDAIRKHTLESLWNQTADILILIEKGTPVGSRIITDARQHILDLTRKNVMIAEDVHVVAPCPHESTCPMLRSAKKGWCHFSQRLQRPSFLMKTKHVNSNLEDVKYSYVILRRRKRPIITTASDISINAYSWPRLILPPLKRTGHIVMDTCSSNGDLERIIIPKSQGKLEFKDAKKAMWGDIFPHAPKNPAVKWEEKVLVDKKTLKKERKGRIESNHNLLDELKN